MGVLVVVGPQPCDWVLFYEPAREYTQICVLGTILRAWLWQNVGSGILAVMSA